MTIQSSRSARRVLAGILALAALAPAMPASAQQPSQSAIPSYGDFSPIAGFATQPDPALRYRVLFSVSEASKDPATVNPSLERVARFANILAAGGVRPKPGDLVAIVYGGGTAAVLKDDAYAARMKADKNPNLALIRELQDAGVTIAVCSQALAGRDIKPEQVAPNVRIDASAITTIATLELQGWAYLPD